MNKLTRKLIIAFMLCIVPFLLNAAKVGVLHLKAVGVDDATAEAVADLLVNDLINYGHQVLNPEAMDGAAGEVLKCYESQCAAEAGFKAQVERVIYGSVSKLGEKHMLQVAVVNVSTREVVWSGSAAAKTAEDLDVVVKRVAKAIVEGKKIEEGAEIGLITEQEVKEEVKRKESFYAAGGSFGMVFPLGGYANADQLMGMTLITWLETKDFLVNFNFPYYWSLGAMTFDTSVTQEPSVIDYGMDITFDYLFSRQDISPFIGGGMGIHLLGLRTGFESDVNFGLSFKGGGGIVFLRTYDFHIVLDASYMLNMAELSYYTGPHHGFSINLGVIKRIKERGGCFGGGCGGGGCF